MNLLKRKSGFIFTNIIVTASFLVIFSNARQAVAEFTGTETQITSNPSSETKPVIYGDKIVWIKDYNLWLYDISTQKTIQITNNFAVGSGIRNPAIYNDRIVWVAYPSNWVSDIYMYDISTNEVKKISHRGKARGTVDIYENKIVWDEHNNINGVSSIYMYDIVKNEEKLITDTSGFSTFLSKGDPAIYDDKIVYTTSMFGSKITMYNLTTQSEIEIMGWHAGLGHHQPDIYGNKIIWLSEHSNWESISLYDLVSGTRDEIYYTDVLNQRIVDFPSIYGDKIVWSTYTLDASDHWFALYLYNIPLKKQTKLIFQKGTIQYVTIHQDKIVWQDDRNGNTDIYMYQFASSNNPPTLFFPTTEPYAGDGIEPNKGTVETEFTFKTVYTDADNDPPQNISLVVGDDIATTRTLAVDASAPVELRDGNYANGEQFTATSIFPKKAKHFYHFEASDGKGGTARIPKIGELQFSVINVPVIIVPGIMGSYLIRNYEPIKSQIWPPSIIDDLLQNQIKTELSLDEYGAEKTYFPMSLGDIIKEHSDTDIFESLIIELKTNGYTEEGENKDLFVFPYDWRFNLIASASSLKSKVEEIKEQTGVDKVDIIAHSMGGLVAKFYIQDHGKNLVRKFIDIATPHLGAPKAFRTLMWGDPSMAPKWLGEIGAYLSASITKGLARNMPSAYQLLPSERYFAKIGPYFNDVFDMDENGVTGWLDYASTTDFLVKYGRRNNNADKWNSLIHNSIDNWNGKEYGVEETVNIVGCGAATIGDIWAFNGKFKGLNEKQGFDVEYMLRYTSGDGTVPYKSAEGLQNLYADTTYYAYANVNINNTNIENNISTPAFLDEATADLIEHSQLPSLLPKLIYSVLNNQEPSLTPTLFLKISKESNNCDIFSGKTISFHSPIELHVYGSQNRHTGPTADGFIENNIPGVQYDVIEDNKFAFLPDGETYTITGQATGVGTFNARIVTYQNSEVTETRYYNEIPLKSLETNTTFTIAPNQTDYTIQVDQDGDGMFESQAQPSSVLNAKESQDLTKPETTISLSGNQGQNNWYVSDVEVGFSVVDDNSGILKTEYSLDNGQTWNIYQQLFTIATEGTTSILYLSTDRAGNYELLKSKEVKIDKTPPEAKISFDQNLKQLMVEGVDNLSSVSVIQSDTTYTLTDEAGHILVVDFDKLKTEGKEIKAEISALRYDSVPAPAVPENKLQYERSLEKNGDIKELNQRIEVKKIFDVHTHYDAKKNETAIDIKREDEDEENKTKQILQGLTLLILTTHSGNLSLNLFD